MYVCLFVGMFVCMYVCLYVWMSVWMYVCMYVCMYICIYVCMHACMYVYIHECMYTHMSRPILSGLILPSFLPHCVFVKSIVIKIAKKKSKSELSLFVYSETGHCQVQFCV